MLLNTLQKKVFDKLVEITDNTTYWSSSKNVSTVEEIDEAAEGLVTIFSDLVSKHKHHGNEHLPFTIDDFNNNSYFCGMQLPNSECANAIARVNEVDVIRRWEYSEEDGNRIVSCTRGASFNALGILFRTGELQTDVAKAILSLPETRSQIRSVTYYKDTNQIVYYHAIEEYAINRRGFLYLGKKVHNKLTINFDRKHIRLFNGKVHRYISLKNWELLRIFFEEDLVKEVFVMGDQNLEFITNELPLSNFYIPNKITRKSTSLKTLMRNAFGFSCDYAIKQFGIKKAFTLCSSFLLTKETYDAFVTQHKAITPNQLIMLDSLAKNYLLGEDEKGVLVGLFLAKSGALDEIAEIQPNDINLLRPRGVIYNRELEPTEPSLIDKVIMIRDTINMCDQLKEPFPIRMKSYRRLVDLHDDQLIRIRVNHVSDFKVAPCFNGLLDATETMGVRLVLNKEELIKEGIEMKHCVATRAGLIANGTACVFSITGKNYDPKTLNGRYTAQINRVKSNGEDLFTLNEIKGYRNSVADPEVIEAIKEQLKKRNPTYRGILSVVNEEILEDADELVF